MAVSANRLELLQIAQAVAQEKAIDKHIVLDAMADAIGALLLKTVTALVFFSGFPALAQPLFEGVILAVAVALGALPLIRSSDRLSVMAR